MRGAYHEPGAGRRLRATQYSYVRSLAKFCVLCGTVIDSDSKGAWDACLDDAMRSPGHRETARKNRVRRAAVALRACLIVAAGAGGASHAADEASTAKPVLQKYCYTCHGKAAMAGLNLQQLASQPSMGESFQHWEKVAAAMEQKRMPPAKMPQPSDEERREAVAQIRGSLNAYAAKHAGDPGRVTVRRLTSAEYAYTVSDLTGVDLKTDQNFASDSVGGEGFTNFGDVQFMQDANLERYLETAKLIAGHAVIGAGPLQFYEDPGESGREMSAIGRIQEIYRTHGFRAASAEGGQPFGLERYSKAFYTAWRYRHRAALGERNATLEAMGVREGLSPRFVQHIWTVLQQPSPAFPSSEVVTRWRKLPAPNGSGDDKTVAAARAGCDDIQHFLINWPRHLFAAGELAMGGLGDERALVITEASLDVKAAHHLKFTLRTRDQKASRMYLTVLSMNPAPKEKPVVQWRNATLRFRTPDKGVSAPQPLAELLDEASAKRLGIVQGAESSFTTTGDTVQFFEVKTPPGAVSAELQVDAALLPEHQGGDVLRLTISQDENVSKGSAAWALLANARSAAYQAWKAGVLQFAVNLPQTSQSEAAPADRDPIPEPFDNTYNQPDRDLFHVKLKYYRSDRFLIEKMLDDATRARLEDAWADLLSSFDYHDEFLRFTAGKYKLDLKGKSIADLTDAQIAAMPDEPRKIVKALRAEYAATHRALEAAQPGHVEDCVRFAARAWRRPLTAQEKESLRSFYRSLRQTAKLDHDKATRAVLARILVAPAFLYRLEQPPQVAGVTPLSDWELASRLSYFLWSSLPDEELRRAAAAGELRNPQQLERQAKRMLADPKARRMSTEFFGQWLGFYRFDQYRGVDTGRFPEFTDELKSAMYDEAVSFFEHVIRKDRPVREILFADYTFLNQPLAKFYGVTKPVTSKTDPELVEGANGFHRGGLLRLGAVLTTTSAPLRTSPVKRGDWVLRRLLGTPTPPPPADAGSLPADDKSFGGLSVLEKLKTHIRNPSCAGCHTRIDPLGFPLERYDAIGRWRDQYPDGKPVHDYSTTADQVRIAGIEGLVDYLKTEEKQVLRTVSQKLIGYALGRTMLASDKPLVDRLVNDDGKAGFSRWVTEIVTSKQFRYRREREDAPPAPPRQVAQASAAMNTNGESGR